MILVSFAPFVPPVMIPTGFEIGAAQLYVIPVGIIDDGGLLVGVKLMAAPLQTVKV